MGAGRRWLVAVLAALAAFGGCWLALALEDVLDTGAQVGVASVPLVVLLAALGAWAERAREHNKHQEDAPGGGGDSARVEGSPQGQAIGRIDGGVNFGPGASLTNPVFHLGSEENPAKEPLRASAAGPRACWWWGMCRRSLRRSSRVRG